MLSPSALARSGVVIGHADIWHEECWERDPSNEGHEAYSLSRFELDGYEDEGLTTCGGCGGHLDEPALVNEDEYDGPRD